MASDEVTLKVSSRPLRLALIPGDRAQMMQLIRIVSHAWGGAGSLILPQPTTQEERDSTLNALRRFDPDLIAFPGDVGNDTQLVAALDDLPVKRTSVAEYQLRWPFDEDANTAPGLGDRYLIHPIWVLNSMFPTGNPNSAIRLLTDNAPLTFETVLHFGDASPAYAQYLRERFNARTLSAPRTVPDLIRMASLASLRYTTLRTTLLECTSRGMGGVEHSQRTDLTGIRARDPHTMFLFLDDGVGLHLPTACWNARRLNLSGNHQLLPRDEFLSDLTGHLRLLLEFWRFRELVVLVSGTVDSARELHQRVEQSMAEIRHTMAGVELIPVKVFFGGCAYEVPAGTHGSRTIETSTRAIGADRSVRFTPTAPSWYPTGLQFGLDVDVEFAGGAPQQLPTASWSSIALQNDVERLRRADEDPKVFGSHGLRRSTCVRARHKGLAILTTPGDEVKVYLHEDETLLQRYLLSRNVRLRPNKHTRYAQGFVQRFGGIERTLRLIRGGGGHLLQALSSRAAHEGGLSYQRLAGLVARDASVEIAAARAAIDDQLPPLLAAGLVRRGVGVRCTHCRLADWRAIDKISEAIECRGCAARFPLETLTKLELSYKANELASRFIAEGGRSVLMAANALREVQKDGMMQFGGDLYLGEEAEPFAEVDLIAFWRGGIAVAECKSRVERLSDEDRSNIMESVRRNMSAAVAVGADALILALVTRAQTATLREELREFGRTVSTLPLAVHLLVNGALHLNCVESPVQPRECVVANLVPAPVRTRTDWSVGQLPSTWGPRMDDPIDAQLLREWESSIIQ